MKYNKPGRTTEQLVANLRSKGLCIQNGSRAADYIRNIGYFRLKAYFYPLYREPKNRHLFKDGATFDNVMNMYRFDRRLRVILFNEIEKIEVAFRSAMANVVSEVLGDLFWMTKEEYFKDAAHFETSLDLIRYEYGRSKEEFIIHFKNKYSDDFPPAWMIAEILPLGNLSHIYMNLRSSRAKKRVAKYFGLQEPVFASWMLVLGNLRNMCCHHARTWNRVLAINTADPQVTAYPWIDVSKTDPKRIYYRICMIRYLLFTISPHNSLKEKLMTLVDQFPTVDIGAVGFPADWKDELLWQQSNRQGS